MRTTKTKMDLAKVLLDKNLFDTGSYFEVDYGHGNGDGKIMAVRKNDGEWIEIDYGEAPWERPPEPHWTDDVEAGLPV